MKNIIKIITIILLFNADKLYGQNDLIGATKLYSIGKYSKSLRLLNTIKAEQRDKNYHLLYLSVLYNKGDFKSAIKYLQNNDSILVYKDVLQMATKIYSETFNMNNAIDCAFKVLKFDSNDYFANISIISNSTILHNRADSIVTVAKRLERLRSKDNMKEVNFYLGNYYLIIKNYEKSFLLIETLCDADTCNDFTYLYLYSKMCYFNSLGRHKEVIIAFEKFSKTFRMITDDTLLLNIIEDSYAQLLNNKSERIFFYNSFEANQKKFPKRFVNEMWSKYNQTTN